jgi:GTP diphosphokinase / guanosine-3',5'-bis(diphosphate) 3'-diphosphatase
MSPKELVIANLEKNQGIDFDQLIDEIKRYMPNVDEKKIKKAFDFAAQAHSGQFRKDESPYITHPYETARILTSMHVDEDTIIAAILHDVPEDTKYTLRDITSRFGKEVSFLVNGITKLAKVYYKNDMARRQIESLKKLFLHTTQDPRIILIKLADRLHNMRTLQYIKNDAKKIRIARETLEIFVPIANLVGIEEMKAELEDLCFKFLLPDEYATMYERAKRNREKNQPILDKTIEMIDNEFKKHRIHATVVGRQMHLYGIYKRVTNSAHRLDEYDNLIPIRILVQYKDECYKVLGILHSLFKPKPGKFKDYIAVPKMNGYQSLHSTVFGINGATTEFQIRTHQMHLEAEYGMASHYFYTAKKDKRLALDEDKRSNWVDKIVQIQKLQDQDTDFMEDLKRDVLRDRIFVFTPKGQSVDLPQDATCIDFAYQIHTEIGHRALKAEVNGVFVPMATALNSGDTVYIIASDFPKGPDRSWLPFAKTNTAKNRIRDYFRKTSRENKIAMGKTLLQKELDRAGLGLIKDIHYKKIKKYISQFTQYHNFDEILAAIGEGSLRPLDFLSELYPQKTATLGPMKWLEIPVKKKKEQSYTSVSIKIVSKDAVGQLEKILRVISMLHINAVQTKAYISFWTGDFICKQTLAIRNFSLVSALFENLEQIEGVKKVERLFWQRKVVFSNAVFFTFALWAVHPVLLQFFISHLPDGRNTLYIRPLLYGGLLMIFMMVYLLKKLTQRSFPELRETNIYWTVTYLLSVFATITVYSEIFFLKLDFDILTVSIMTVLFFSYLTFEYLAYRKRMKKT